MGAPARDALAELRTRALAGDEPACRELLIALTPVVHHRVARVLRRRGDARAGDRELDLVQEVFVVLLDRDARVLRSWNDEGGLSLANFVGLVAEREIHSILRSGRRSAWAEDPTDATFLSDAAARRGDETCHAVAARELLGLVLEHLQAHLSPRGYAIFEAVFLDERSPDDVMRTFGLSANALSTFRSRVRKNASELAQTLGGGPTPAEAASPAPGTSSGKAIA